MDRLDSFEELDRNQIIDCRSELVVPAPSDLNCLPRKLNAYCAIYVIALATIFAKVFNEISGKFLIMNKQRDALILVGVGKNLGYQPVLGSVTLHEMEQIIR